MTDIKKAVQEKYGAIATAVASKDPAATAKVGCCGPSSCGCSDPITSNLYSDAERDALPDTAVAASLGCGNPAPAAASTCCSPRSASARRARRTAWT